MKKNKQKKPKMHLLRKKQMNKIPQQETQHKKEKQKKTI